MRIGIRVTQRDLTGAYVRNDGRFGSASVAVGADGAAGAIEPLVAALTAAGGGTDDPAVSVTFDVSAALRSAPVASVTAIRIAPRAPGDPVFDDAGATTSRHVTRIVHVSGGHTKAGEELAPFDAAMLRAFALSGPRRERYVVTAVGSLVNPAHELEAGRILQEHCEPASVGSSHTFPSTSFSIRERTAALNSALIPEAETLGTALGLAVGDRLPGARLYVATNDGGCAPLAGLSLAPVHSMHADGACELVGAAALAGIDDGRILIVDGDRRILGELIQGMPTVQARFRNADGETLATHVAHLPPGVEGLVNGRIDAPVVVSTDRAPKTLPFQLTTGVRARVDLGALGAACAPPAEWMHGIARIGDKADLEQALASAEARVTARLVSFGAVPSQVRVLESRVQSTPYENPNIVGIRVRAVAGDSVGGMLRRRGGHAPH